MKVSDFNLLKKLMPMTRSDADAEVLMAIRKANKILETSSTNWENVFNRLVTTEIEAAYESAPVAARDLDVSQKKAYLGQLLEDAAAKANGTFADFVLDLQQQFEEKGWLSRGQIEALEKSVARQR